jgi:hypothetical protein
MRTTNTTSSYIGLNELVLVRTWSELSELGCGNNIRRFGKLNSLPKGLILVNRGDKLSSEYCVNRLIRTFSTSSVAQTDN